ncbi:MAG: ATP-binding cassette domain-containing protein, partial [Devosia sp.]
MPAERPSAQPAAPILVVEDLNVHYDTTDGPAKAVADVSFSLRPGERLGLIGESGSGKTTMATALMRLTRAPGRIAGGRVLLDGQDLLQMSTAELRATRLRDIALIPQGAMSSLNPVMRLGDQIIDAIAAHVPRMSRAALEQRVGELLTSVGLDPSAARRYPHELSGGMKQRAAMAIATSLQPKVIVADEPTSALDVVV